jgi:hypothetical protein
MGVGVGEGMERHGARALKTLYFLEYDDMEIMVESDYSRGLGGGDEIKISPFGDIWV